MTAADMAVSVVMSAVNQVSELGGNTVPIWVALVITLPALITSASGAVAAHRTGPNSRLQKDVKYIKRVVVQHVTNRELHPELDDTDTGSRFRKGKRDG